MYVSVHVLEVREDNIRYYLCLILIKQDRGLSQNFENLSITCNIATTWLKPCIKHWGYTPLLGKKIQD